MKPRKEEVMKTKIVKFGLGLLLLASWVLVSDVSFAKDKGRFWAPVIAKYDNNKDWQGPNLPSHLFKAPLQPSRYIGFNDGDKDRDHHYRWDKDKHHHHKHHHHPSPCK